jgi:broad specificity phosphatase PhoE
MKGFLFVRHTAHDLIKSTIAGRMAGVHLNAAGRAAAEQLAEELSSLPITRIYSGPLERARETAEALSRKLNLPLQIAAEFDELETGEWTGKTFEELSSDNRWRKWNAFRSTATIPGGEVMLDVQLRVLKKLSQLGAGQGLTAIFSHGDVIRATAAYFLGVPLDLFLRIAIDPGSVTWVDLYEDAVVVKLVNGTGADAFRAYHANP